MKTKTVSVSEFKEKSLGLFAEIEAKGTQITVTKRGKVIAIVLPLKSEKKSGHEKGKLQHMLISEGDLVSPIEDDWETNK